VRTIWKFRIMGRNGVQADRVGMPVGAIVRHVGTQDGEVFVWAEVDDSAPPTDREFVVHGTGHPINAAATTYVGSTFDGPSVWHVYEATS